MKEEGFVPIIFILATLIISAGVIGGTSYIKQNNLIRFLQAPQSPQSSSLIVSPTPTIKKPTAQPSIDQNSEASDSTQIKSDTVKKVSTGPLLSCSNNRDSIQCPEGFTCYHSVPGGPGSPPLPESGDKKCHQNCTFDSDCPTNAPICIKKPIELGDTFNPNNNICLSKNEGLKTRQDDYQKCFKEKNTNYNELVKDEVKDDDLNIMVSVFSKYSPDFLRNDFNLTILDSFKDNILKTTTYTVIPNNSANRDKEAFIRITCQLSLDSRVDWMANLYYKDKGI